MPQSWPAGQPKVWTFIDFEAPDDMAEELALAIPDVLKARKARSTRGSELHRRTLGLGSEVAA
jgi:hypothetical protein